MFAETLECPLDLGDCANPEPVPPHYADASLELTTGPFPMNILMGHELNLYG